MKKLLLMLVGVGFITVAQQAISSEDELIQQRCEEQLIEDNIEETSRDEYMSDCVRYYQDIGQSIQEESDNIEEMTEENEAKY